MTFFVKKNGEILTQLKRRSAAVSGSPLRYCVRRSHLGSAANAASRGMSPLGTAMGSIVDQADGRGHACDGGYSQVGGLDPINRSATFLKNPTPSRFHGPRMLVAPPPGQGSIFA